MTMINPKHHLTQQLLADEHPDRIPEVQAFLKGKEKPAPSNDEAAEALLSKQELKVAWIKAFVDVTNLGKLPDDPRQRAAVVQILSAVEELAQIEQDRPESSEQNTSASELPCE